LCGEVRVIVRRCPQARQEIRQNDNDKITNPVVE
jgi:hypothetical protein